MAETFDIFISFKNLDDNGRTTRDSELAADLHRYLTARGWRAFYSNISVGSLGESAYASVIDRALDTSTFMLVVATTPDRVNSRWVHYEWDSFHNDLLNGTKPHGQIVTYLEGMTTPELPRALRRHQSFAHGPGSKDEVAAFIASALPATESSLCLKSEPGSITHQTARDRIVEGAGRCTNITVAVTPAEAAIEPAGLRRLGKRIRSARRSALLTALMAAISVAIWLSVRRDGDDPLVKQRRAEIESQVAEILTRQPSPMYEHPKAFDEVAQFAPIDNSPYTVLTDHQVVDLRLWKDVPPDKLHTLHSAVCQTRERKIKKNATSSLFLSDVRTSGLDAFAQTPSPFPYTLSLLKGEIFVGQDRMKVRRLAIDVRTIPTGTTFELKTESTFWNSLQTPREQWIGLMGYQSAIKASMLIVFPDGKPFADFELQTATGIKDKSEKFTGAKIILTSESRNWIYWEVPNPEFERVYRLYWSW